jgi:hypothetical protein
MLDEKQGRRNRKSYETSAHWKFGSICLLFRNYAGRRRLSELHTLPELALMSSSDEITRKLWNAEVPYV